MGGGECGGGGEGGRERGGRGVRAYLHARLDGLGWGTDNRAEGLADCTRHQVDKKRVLHRPRTRTPVSQRTSRRERTGERSGEDPEVEGPWELVTAPKKLVASRRVLAASYTPR